MALAGALAWALEVKLTRLPFNADEKMNDDLRSVEGHYLGFGQAVVLLHVPADRPLMTANLRDNLFAPYCRVRLMIVRNLAAMPKLESLDDLLNQKIAVPGQSLAGWLLIGAESGKLREQLRTSFNDATDDAALPRGEAVAAACQALELESVLSGDPALRASRCRCPACAALGQKAWRSRRRATTSPVRCRRPSTC